MKILYRLALGLVLLLRALPAFSVIDCSVTTNPTDIVVTHNQLFGATTQGAINLTCTRAATDTKTPTIWIGMTQPAAGRTATLDTGTATITYEIDHAGSNSGTWTDTGGAVHTSTNNVAVQEAINFGNATTIPVSFPFYFFDNYLQFNKPAGVYVDSIPITVRLNNATGTILDQTSMDIHISLPKACHFSSAPSIDVSYVAFSKTPVTGTGSFSITCTNGTPYTVTLSPARSVVPTVDLAYGLSLTTPGTTTLTGSALAQTYTVNISVDAGQPGTCSVAVCNGIDTAPTLTVNY
jgi:spore coat protein U-like protein